MIGLMDCNNFFVSCERLFRPDLLKRPVAVLSSNDGCIVARSQEVRDLGVPMGVPYFQVKEVLTKAGVVLFSSNFTLYRDISERVMSILEDEVGLCEVYSIDEAFFELPDTVTEAAVLAIRSRVMREVGIPVSIGVAHTKTLAKQASKIGKRRGGVCVITPEVLEHEVYPAPCASVWGLGGKTVTKLRSHGVTTIAEFLALPVRFIRTHFGVVGERIHMELSGVSVYALGEHHDDVQQSIMSTRSFEKTTCDLHALESALAYHIEEIASKLREKKVHARNLSIMILPSRHGDFFMHRGSYEVVLPTPTQETHTLMHEALRGLRTVYEKGVPYKKAGAVVSGLLPVDSSTASLFVEQTPTQLGALDAITDMINEKFGHGTVHSGVIKKSGSGGSAKLRSKEYTTQWKDIPTVKA